MVDQIIAQVGVGLERGLPAPSRPWCQEVTPGGALRQVLNGQGQGWSGPIRAGGGGRVGLS